ncbi:MULTISPECIES: acyl carrier protein [Nocardia]|uniref:Phosphopantetheine-binding protein n=2 Tax=Nocardia TaxID=1817 RepID=K0ER19_NOCB7|nr:MULTISPECIES: acyl carrier protein [Nocardia]AFT99453.1 phosphopantetheine-binding protein [Nocardia brasiliensis ATCC 700358]ASF09578.1 acyl carrier protein [Nocardia brasiliensis]KIA66742.1 actinorhodin polyketide synthase acyl carrier protein [Nocardia vulneris]OCF90416.1 actinorhodin polyketide synthase [Nocardia brasiliensis]SUB55405.1 Oxytetracycline polyketide synthase acyl carrier protein [Nocardia brasiliensis]
MADRFTLTDLGRIMLEAAGDEGIDFAEPVLDVLFDDLGYDSLALLEASGRIEREFEISLDEDTLLSATTPRALIGAVNARLVNAA